MSGFRIAPAPSPIALPKAKPKDWTDRLFENRPGATSILCKWCSREMFVPTSKVGQRSTCDKICADHFRASLTPVKPWAERLSDPRAGTVKKPCEMCGSAMNLPQSKAGRRYCSNDCQYTARLAVKAEKTRRCETCGNAFLGRGKSSKFCSQKCNAASGRLSSPENLAAAQEGKRRAIRDGKIKWKTGSDNPLWKGGPRALRQRQTASGKNAMWLRRYRKSNPDKIREFASNRSSRKRGKLPYGSLTRVRRMQKDKCAICAVKLKGGGHVDHIVPLAKGGAHKPSNIQFLCAPCNLHKSARDPIQHMQSLGRLL